MPQSKDGVFLTYTFKLNPLNGVLLVILSFELKDAGYSGYEAMIAPGRGTL